MSVFLLFLLSFFEYTWMRIKNIKKSIINWCFTKVDNIYDSVTPTIVNARINNNTFTQRLSAYYEFEAVTYTIPELCRFISNFEDIDTTSTMDLYIIMYKDNAYYHSYVDLINEVDKLTNTPLISESVYFTKQLIQNITSSIEIDLSTPEIEEVNDEETSTPEVEEVNDEEVNDEETSTPEVEEVNEEVKNEDASIPEVEEVSTPEVEEVSTPEVTNFEKNNILETSME